MLRHYLKAYEAERRVLQDHYPGHTDAEPEHATAFTLVQAPFRMVQRRRRHLLSSSDRGIQFADF